jgi:site-specific DNA-methyltransferase (adenine-specific)
MTEPYYEHAGITIYHGDCREILPGLEADVVVTDPPYGIGYETNWNKLGGWGRARSIEGDGSTAARDAALALLVGVPALVFGSWKAEPPNGARLRLLWEKLGSSGMGDLSAPWRPNVEDIFVLGKGWAQVEGRESCVLRFNALCGEQDHPNEKPGALLRYLIGRCPAGVILDPFMGSGTTLRAAKDLGRKAIGIEIEERYCEIAAKRLGQEVFAFD